jgi:hypothetical protein
MVYLPVSGHTRAAFYLPRLRVEAVVETGRERLSDVLNSTLSSYVEVREVQVFRVDEAGSDDPMRSFRVGLLRKADVQCVVIREEPERRSERAAARVPTEAVSVFAALAWMEVVGTHHFPRGTAGRADPLVGLRERGEGFLPLTDATARFLQGSAADFRANVLLVNRAAIQALCIVDGGETPDTNEG